MNGNVKNSIIRALAETVQNVEVCPLPEGRLTSPLKGVGILEVISVKGYTVNIPPDHYAWLVIDVPRQGICWPKVPVGTNIHFQTLIPDKGEHPVFQLALYLTDGDYHQAFMAWHKSKSRKGLPLLPRKWLLDSVPLFLSRTK